MTSCGADYYLKRAIAKDPSILQQEIVRLDTVLITKERILRDTIVSAKYDTIERIQNNVSIKIVRINDTILVDVLCPQDTIFFTKEIKVDKLVYNKKRPSEIIFLWALLIVLFLLYLIRIVKHLL
tara:strand:- start:3203 stop:3577 length:375 start_codon:yes stop_codon:yes gene_type:complete